MQSCESSVESWAKSELKTARLGDSRRVERSASMLLRAAEHPAGKISEVVKDPAERQGAYDLLEGKRVGAGAMCAAFADATLARAGDGLTYAAIDGTALQFTDLTGKKGLGTVGNLLHGAPGLKVINALAVDEHGVTLGLLDQVWWARTTAQKRTAKKKKRRSLSEKETRHWVTAINQASSRAKARGRRLWFQLDREADNNDILKALADVVAEGRHEFTVRGAWDRLLVGSGKDKQYLRKELEGQPPIGAYLIDVPEGKNRTARMATMHVRVAKVTLHLRGQKKCETRFLELNVVLAREAGAVPVGEDPLDWLLLTTHSIETMEDAYAVVHGYTQRWRIEEFHRAWKSGACKVEEAQLRSMEALTLWATMLATVAARIERLKLKARSTPDEPASNELARHEIRALVLLKRARARRSRREVISDAPTIGQAVLLIAELGGYTGKSSGGPPGSITIRRGLEVLGPAAELLRALEPEGG